MSTKNRPKWLHFRQPSHSFIPFLRHHWRTHAAIVSIVTVIVILAISTGSYALFFASSPQPADASSVNLQKGLVGYWKLDGNAKDSTPYANNGTLSSPPPTPATDREGQANSAYSFNGTSNYIQLPNMAITANAFSASTWFETTTTGDKKLISTSSNSHLIQMFTNGNLRVCIVGCTVGTHNFADGKWHYAVVVGDATSIRLYVDGSTTPEVTLAAYAGDIGGTIRLGMDGSGTGYYYAGSMAGVRIYDRAINPAEVRALYDSYNPGVQLGSLSSGLVGEWKLNGNAKDSTPYGNNGTVHGATPTTGREGAANGAYNFDGASNITVGVPLPATATFSLWATWTGAGGKMLFLVGPSGTGPDLYLACNDIIWNTWNGCTNSFGSVPVSASDGNYHLYTVVAAPGNTKLYYDGQLVGTANYVSPSGNLLTIGAGSYKWTGNIEDFRLYNRALSAREISNLYNSYDSQINLGTSSTTTGQGVNLTKGLVGYWPFNGNAKDATPYQENGTVTGATLTTDRFGRASSAYSFNGSGDYIDMGTSSITGTQPFTLAAWMNTTQLSAYSGALAIGPSSSNQSAYIGTVATAQVGTGQSLGGGFYAYNIGSGVKTTNGWAHVAMTYDGSTADIYVNGVLTNSTGYVAAMAAGPLRVGRIGTDTTYDFHGSVDDARLYNRALSAAEVQALYSLND